MPPKSLSRSATKRKVEDRDTDTDDAESQPTSSKLTKKPKKTGTLDSLPHNGQPTNKTLPVNIEFEKPDEGTLRIATWNVCGLAASMRKGFKYYVEAEDADILVLTETKVNDIPADPALKSRYPHQYWSISDKKTYAGTAILSKVKPLHVDYKLPGHPNPKGRILTLEFENAYLIGTYVVNAGQELKTMDAKKEWQTHFEAYIRELDKKKPVIWTGDLNVAPTEKEDDPERPQFVDVWRKLHPDLQHYTYWSYRFQSREKGNGWRLDMFVLSTKLVDRVKKCEIRDEIYGASDHVPLIMDIENIL
ncbi:DNA-(apurinic or apyrimidinic site) lyase [Coprinopsis cinerea okayama7|uniref:DNA-(Apurinic or apyrimidinic site) lyase n=1 Tax=Coprinopsis cinerea (strain Okayama-7 / 130 / ATCC MYA-4618 / FGSC 9003) TaxID=240176 RepID=A8NEM2_COPC7|nr:DNA-(apurinic or apyrimidinic site) lyase [Coprinopsis cinerea okayama7\|eukprot:XP_001833071.2 DNA-(apurinic or apyrimidinic site) lyase [Coprinopsis cinerea okayama7\